MHRLVHTIRQIARHEMDGHWHPALAVVKSVHGADGEKNYACTVELRETGLVLPKVPIATGLIGLASLPRENDLVAVMFAGGDLHAPIVVGRLYSQDVPPPEHEPGELVTVLPGDETSPDQRLELRIRTPGDGSRALNLVLDGAVRVELAIDDQGMSLQAQDAQIEIKQTSSSDGQVEVKVGGSRLKIEQSGDITIEAQGTLKLKATKIDISGDATVKISGATIDLN